MATGMVGLFGVGVESSGGASATGAYSATVIAYIPFTSENLTLQRNDLPDPSIWANYYKRKIYNGLQRVEGGVQLLAHPIDTGYLLRPCFDVCTAIVGSGGMIVGATSHGGVREHRFVATGDRQFHTGSGSDLPTITAEVNRGPIMGGGSSFLYYNCAGNVCEIVVEAGNFIRTNFEFMGRDYGGKPRSTPSFAPPAAWTWDQVSVSVDGAAKPYYEALTFRLENNLSADPTLDGRLRPDTIKYNDFRRVVVNGSIAFRNFDDYNGFVNGSETNLVATFTGKQISSTPTNFEVLRIDAPRFRYSTFPLNIGGPGRTVVGFTGESVMDTVSLYACQVTLVNTRLSAYSVNTTA